MQIGVASGTRSVGVVHKTVSAARPDPHVTVRESTLLPLPACPLTRTNNRIRRDRKVSIEPKLRVIKSNYLRTTRALCQRIALGAEPQQRTRGCVSFVGGNSSGTNGFLAHCAALLFLATTVRTCETGHKSNAPVRLVCGGRSHRAEVSAADKTICCASGRLRGHCYLIPMPADVQVA